MDEKLSIILEKYPRRNQLDVNFTFVSCTGKSKANLKSNQDSFLIEICGTLWDFVGGFPLVFLDLMLYVSSYIYFLILFDYR